MNEPFFIDLIYIYFGAIIKDDVNQNIFTRKAYPCFAQNTRGGKNQSHLEKNHIQQMLRSKWINQGHLGGLVG